MAMGKVKPNNFYGFRTAATMRDDATWYRANAYGGRAMIVCGALIAALTLLLTPLSHAGISRADLSLIAGVFQVVPLLVMTILLLRYSARLRN
jgi:uncharacterized membrane protein